MTRRRRRSRAGFSLLEVIVAMTLLVTVMSALGTLSYRVAKRGEGNDLIAKRSFALQHEANRFGAMTFTELAAQTNGSEAGLLGDFLFTRTLTVTAIAADRYTIKIVVIPDLDPARADSIMFDRTKPVPQTPLCTTC